MSAAGALVALGAAALAALGSAVSKKPRAMTTEIPLTTIADYRRAARALALYAVDGDRGRPAHGDPVYTGITLGIQDDARAQGWFFSSCAFLPHWILETLGVVRPYVGRSRQADEPLSRLVWSPESEPVTPATRFAAGDVVHIGSNGDSHVLVVLDYDPPGAANGFEGQLVSADYGQPGGKVRYRRVYVDNSGALIVEDSERSRPARRYLPLARAVEASVAEHGPMTALVVEDPAILRWYEPAPSGPVAPSVAPSVARRAIAPRGPGAGPLVLVALAVLGAVIAAKMGGA